MRKRKTDIAPIPMPPRVRSLIGARFGRLLVRFYAGMDKQHKSFWCCECECGNFCRVPGARLLGTSGKDRDHGQVSCGCARADSGIRLAARLKMPAKRRAEICKKMRESVKARKPAYSMDAHRACEMLGISMERLRVMVDAEEIAHRYKRGALWVSSQDVSRILAERERKQNRCPIRAIFKP